MPLCIKERLLSSSSQLERILVPKYCSLVCVFTYRDLFFFFFFFLFIFLVFCFCCLCCYFIPILLSLLRKEGGEWVFLRERGSFPYIHMTYVGNIYTDTYIHSYIHIHEVQIMHGGKLSTQWKVNLLMIFWYKLILTLHSGLKLMWSLIIC
jgi:hypothetical protein